MPDKFKVYILWGADRSSGDTPTIYEFDSQKELDAFMYGIDEAYGWSQYVSSDKDWDPEEVEDYEVDDFHQSDPM